MRKISIFVDKNLADNHWQLKQMTQRVHNCVPMQLIPHIQVTTINKDSITITVNNPSTAQKLNYCTRTIKNALGIERVKILISHPKAIRRRPIKTRRFIGEKGQIALAEAAETVPHKGIQDALLKLSKQKRTT